MTRSPRWKESSTLPDIAADLRSIQSALGVDPHQHLDFIHIRDDMVAREVKQSSGDRKHCTDIAVLSLWSTVLFIINPRLMACQFLQLLSIGEIQLKREQ